MFRGIIIVAVALACAPWARAGVKCSAGATCLDNAGIQASDAVDWTGAQSFLDANFTIKDSAAPTKLFKLEAGSITAGQTRTWIVPDRSDTLAGLGANTFTGAQSFGGSAAFTGTSRGFGSDQFRLEDSGLDHYYTLTTDDDPTANRRLSINPGDADRVITLTGDPTLNQNVSTTGSPTFAGVTVGAGALATPTVKGPDADSGLLWALSGTETQITSNATKIASFDATNLIGFYKDTYWGADVATTRARANVLSMVAGDWFRQPAGYVILASDQTNATVTPASAGLSVTLIAATKYVCELTLYVADSVAADGLLIDFDGGTATMTAFRADLEIGDSALRTKAQPTALATDTSAATLTGDGTVIARIGMTVNAAGTFIPRFAQAAHTTGTATVYALSWIKCDDVS